MYEFQKRYARVFARGVRQFVEIPIGYGTVEIVKETARLKKLDLVVICPAMLIRARQWGDDIRQYTPQDLRKQRLVFNSSDFVFIDVGVSGRQTLDSLKIALSGGCDFMWRL